MKLYVSNKTIDKIKTLINTQKADTISVRKYKKNVDPASNVIGSIKLNDKQREAHKTGRPYYIYSSKEKLKEIKKHIDINNVDVKEGSFLPLIPLLLSGIAAISGLTGAATGIAKTVIDKKNNDARLEEEQRHNKELESAARGDGIFLNPYRYDGSSVSQGPCAANRKLLLREFTKNLKTDDVGKKTIRSFLKNLSDYVEIGARKNGRGIYLNPLI